MAAVTICSDFETPKYKVSYCCIVSPSISHKVVGADAMILVFWMSSFKPAFSLSFTFIKILFSSSSLSAVGWCHLHIWDYWYFSCNLDSDLFSTSPVFCMMYSAYKINKEGGNIQPWHTLFPIWNQSVVTCPFLTVTSWPAYRFLKRQVK